MADKAEQSREQTRCQKLHVAWLNSPEKEFDSIMRDMKKLLRKAKGGKLVLYFRDSDGGEYETDDLGLAGYLRMKGVEITRLRTG